MSKKILMKLGSAMGHPKKFIEAVRNLDKVLMESYQDGLRANQD